MSYRARQERRHRRASKRPWSVGDLTTYSKILKAYYGPARFAVEQMTERERALAAMRSYRNDEDYWRKPGRSPLTRNMLAWRYFDGEIGLDEDPLSVVAIRPGSLMQAFLGQAGIAVSIPVTGG